MWEMYAEEPISLEHTVGLQADFVTMTKEDYDSLMQIVVAAKVLCEAIRQRFGGDL